MTYLFKGYFIQGFDAEKIDLHDLAVIDNDAVVKEIENPFLGVGIRIPNYPVQQNENISADKIINLAERLGFSEKKWIFLDYQCWGGNLADVMGFVHTGSGNFELLSSDNNQDANMVYKELMVHFGVAEKAAFDFPPFYRGFWGIYYLTRR
jgi:hypothetical protein